MPAGGLPVEQWSDVRTAEHNVRHGFRGDRRAAGVLTPLGTSSTRPFKKQESIIQIKDQYKRMREHEEANDAECHPQNPAVLASISPVAPVNGIDVLIQPGQI